MADRVRAGDIGIVVKIQIKANRKPLPLTGFDVRFDFTQPDGTVLDRTPDIVHSDTGRVQYITAEGEIDDRGDYTVTPYITSTSPPRRYKGTDVVFTAD
jgi:hypothetical protein